MRAISAFREMMKRPLERFLILGLTGFFVAGFLIGWMWFGWIVYPVVYVPGGPDTMTIEEQAEYVELVAELYSYKLDGSQAQIVLADWGGDVLACRMAAVTDDEVRRIRYLALAWAVNERGCE